jgi:hypothetical protein
LSVRSAIRVFVLLYPVGFPERTLLLW